jgi:hypothetical protein
MFFVVDKVFTRSAIFVDTRALNFACGILWVFNEHVHNVRYCYDITVSGKWYKSWCIA